MGKSVMLWYCNRCTLSSQLGEKGGFTEMVTFGEVEKNTVKLPWIKDEIKKGKEEKVVRCSGIGITWHV